MHILDIDKQEIGEVPAWYAWQGAAEMAVVDRHRDQARRGIQCRWAGPPNVGLVLVERVLACDNAIPLTDAVWPDAPVFASSAASVSGIRLALAVGLVAVLALGGLSSWLGYRAYDAHKAELQRRLFGVQKFGDDAKGSSVEFVP